MKIFLIFCKERHSYDFIEGFLIHTVYKICFNKKYILHQERTDLNLGLLLEQVVRELTQELVRMIVSKPMKEKAIYLN